RFDVSPIPRFCDRYHLPAGEYTCTIVEEVFLFSEKRKRKWANFKNMFDRMLELGLKPSVILINGSFVTGRKKPGDVDFAALIPPRVVKDAIKRAENEEDKIGISLFINDNNQGALRAVFGAHLLVADNMEMLSFWSDF